MKTILILALLISNVWAIAQDETRTTKHYQLLIDSPVVHYKYGCSESTISKCYVNPDVLIAPAYSFFTVVEDLGNDGVVIKFWDWNVDPSVTTNPTPEKKANFEKAKLFNYENPLSDKQDNQKFFLLKRKYFNENTRPRYGDAPTFTFGTILLPVKLRFNGFDFSKDITIGSAAGIKIPISKYNPVFLNLVGSAGISSVTLDSSNTKGKVMTNSERGAFTLSFGAILEYKSFQTGLFVGWDFLTSKDAESNWEYNQKAWLGIGIGYSIFTNTTNDKIVNKQQD